MRHISRRHALAATGAAALTTLFPAVIFAEPSDAPFNIPEAESYIRQALHPASPHEATLVRCIDDRYPTGSGTIAVPGGDAGFIGIALACAGLLRDSGRPFPPAQAVEAALVVIGGEARLCWHTDTEAGTDGWGCTHCRFLVKLFERYWLNEESRDALVGVLKDPTTKRPVILEGEHAPSAVFIVDQDDVIDGTVYALESRTTVDDIERRALVYQPTLERRRLDLLALEISARLPGKTGVMPEDLAFIARTHFDLTMRRLAPRVPRFDVTLASDGAFKVTPA